jgi:thioredoxin reductase (NADPH)
METRDVVVIGSGPAGIAAAAALLDGGMDTVVLEKGALADGVMHWPWYMRFFSTAANVELAGYPFIITGEKPTREEYLNYLRRFVHDKGIPVRTRREVTAVRSLPDGGFAVTGADPFGARFEIRAAFVVVSTGAFGQPQTLGVPGEDLPKVSHYFTEVHPYAFTKVAIVGGRSSAAECALLLWRAGAEVTVVHRGASLEGLKYWVQPDIDNRIRGGEIRAFFNSRVVEIQPYHIVVETGTGDRVQVENDFVLAMTGYQPDVRLLEAMGVAVDPETKCPRCDPATLETNVPGIFVAGVIVAGNVSGAIFIENSRHHGRMILDAIRARRGATAGRA